ncbi:Fe-S cluster assembly sulfur transfer protein SufU [Vallitalea okinawensis]|uniref:Fe-S cluster assembly sulfur transfer protein SufU n=1 Tax=Vallitalea okinawensis TaxID=2078660 RepID=UPI000CFB9405|nr:SUF system NifU family Fe-S cluster assembly protein [Vallitalea okinawensis]
MDINDIYTEIILEKSMDKSNQRELSPVDVSKRAYKASCGDDITVHLQYHDHIIQDASFTGTGCAISRASASMMIDLIKGKTKDEAIALSETFIGMIKSEITDEEELEQLDEAIYLKNISKMPARVKCAVLCWHALQEC